MDSSTRHEHTNPKVKADKPLSVVVRPGSMSQLALGTFPTEEAIPELSYSYIPDNPDDIAKVEHRIPTDKGVRLTVSFQNYGSQVMIVFASRKNT